MTTGRIVAWPLGHTEPEFSNSLGRAFLMGEVVRDWWAGCNTSGGMQYRGAEPEARPWSLSLKILILR